MAFPIGRENPSSIFLLINFLDVPGTIIVCNALTGFVW